MDQMYGVVIDNGSGVCKAGFSDEDAPRTVFPSVLGLPRFGRYIGYKSSYVGRDAELKRRILTLKNPIEKGIVTDWDVMEDMWHHIFYNILNASPDEHPVMLTESLLNPTFNREKMSQIMFETFDTPALFISTQSVLSLFANGLTTGIVLESGDAITQTVPVYEGYRMSHANACFDWGGHDLTQYLKTILNQLGYEYDHSISAIVKENLCNVALNFEQKMTANDQLPSNCYQLPDGSEIYLKNEVFQCPEALFQPSLIGMATPGIHNQLYDSIMKCDIDVRRDLYANIVLSGGSTMYPGIEARLHKEMASLAPNSINLRIIAPESRRYSAWIGGAMLASLNSFQSMWFTSQEYDEYGPQMVHRKCL